MGWDKTSNVRPLYFHLLNLKFREECSRTLGMGMGWNLPEQLGCNQGAAAEAYTIGEQQLKWTQLGSSSCAQSTVQRWITQVGERRGSS